MIDLQPYGYPSALPRGTHAMQCLDQLTGIYISRQPHAASTSSRT